MTQTIEQLRARIAELEEEIERLRADNIAFARNLKGKSATTGATYEHICTQLAAAQEENGRLENQVLARDAELWGRTQEILGLKEQLAAEQLNNKLLQDALEFLNARIVTMDLGGVVERALSLPASTEALDKYVAEKVEEMTIERCAEKLLSIGALGDGDFLAAIRALPTGQIKLEELL